MQIDLIVDLQYGSTGKGLLAGYLAETFEHDTVATCNMPNAGHTYIDSLGNKMIHKVLPNGIISPNLERVLIGPGAVFDEGRLYEEIDAALELGYLEEAMIFIHPNAMVLRPEHRQMEQATLSGIASTMQGSMAATTEKMVRDPNKPCLARDVLVPKRPGVVVLDNNSWMEQVGRSRKILAEGSQGFSLGVNQRFHPYCTSRECTPYRLLSDMALPQITVNTWGTLRTYPIRVGNTSDGYSGSVHSDQAEISFEDIGQEVETTTVTGRPRRIFTFSHSQLEEALWHCRPDHLFLNFANYMEPVSLGALSEQIDTIASEFGCKIDLYGYGPTFYDVRHAHTR